MAINNCMNIFSTLYKVHKNQKHRNKKNENPKGSLENTQLTWKFSLFFLIALCISSALTAQEEQSYRLNTGDTIRVEVYREEDLSLSILLNKSGQFNYPYLGLINAQSKTTDQLANEIENKLLGDYLINPDVNVIIEKYRDFYVGGEVRSPGGYPYQPGITVKQAIVIAGGPTEWASSSRYRIQREGSTDSARANNETVIKPGDTLSIGASLF